MTLLGLVVRPGSNDTVWVSHTLFFCYGDVMKEISIFIDESGDFESYEEKVSEIR